MVKLLLQSPPDVENSISFSEQPFCVAAGKNHAVLFGCSSPLFFFDAGFSVCYFLFNRFLLGFGFKERAIGMKGGAATFGSVPGMVPAGLLDRKIGSSA